MKWANKTMAASIVVVDDNTDCAEVVVEMLARWGYQADHLHSGPELLGELAARHAQGRLDLVVTDLFMPEVDGFEIIRFASRGLVGVPVIGMSGGDQGLLDLMVPIGATAAIEKPVDPARLKATVERALAHSVRCV